MTACWLRELMKQRQPDAFPILLAHHPHAFDAAVEADLPLTLSGHTHGGQLMFDSQHGVVRFLSLLVGALHAGTRSNDRVQWNWQLVSDPDQRAGGNRPRHSALRGNPRLTIGCDHWAGHLKNSLFGHEMA